MFAELDRTKQSAEDQLDADLVGEIARNTPSNIAALRKHERVMVRGGMEILPGDLTRVENPDRGSAVDVSAGGCMGVFARPPLVGNVYRVRISSSELDLPMTYAKCVRVRLLRDDAFEAGFAFFAPVELQLKGSLAA